MNRNQDGKRWVLFAFLLLGTALGFGPGCSKESKIAGYVDRGNAYATKGDYLKAEIEFLNAYRLDPENPLVSLHLGDVYFQQGNISKSFVFLKKAADLGNHTEDLRIKLARIYLTIRKFKEARDETTAVLQARPEAEDAWIVYSQACVTTNELRELGQQLQTLRPRADKVAGYHLAAGTWALRRGDLTAAEASFRQALTIAPKLAVAHELMSTIQFRQNDVAGGGRSLKTAAELAPIRSVIPLRYADFLQETGDEAGALRFVEDLVQKAPDFIPASLQLAQMLFAEKRVDDAAAVITRILHMDPINYEAKLLNGRMSLAKGDVAKGLAEMESLAVMHARVPQAHYQLALAYLLNSQPEKALASLGQAVAIDPEHTDSLLLQADLNLRKSDADAVIGAMSDLIRKKPQIGRAYALLGDAYAQRRNSAEAMNAYAKLAQLAPKSPQPHHSVGLLLASEGRLDEARKAFTKARELAPNFYPSFERLVELDFSERKFAEAQARLESEMRSSPKLAGPHVMMARLYLALNNPAKAEASLRKAIDLEPNSAAASIIFAQLLATSGRAKDGLVSLRQLQAKNPKDINVLMQIGMLESETGNYPAARQAYEDLLKVRPDFAAALNNLACLYADRLNMLDRAYELARKARDVVPNDYIVADTLGWIHFKRRDYGVALGLLQQSTPHLSTEPEAFYHLGMVQYMMGDEDGARKSLTSALALPQQFSARADATQRLQVLSTDFSKADATTLAQMEKYLAENPGDPVVSGRLAAIEEKKGNFEKALAIYERAIAENKGNVQAITRAARIYSDQLKNRAKALALARSTRDSSPDDPFITHVLGAIAYANGDPAWAVGLLQDCRRKRPDDPDVLYDLAMAQYRAGQVAESEETLKQAVTLGKPFDRLEAAKRWQTVSSLYQDPTRLRQSSSAVAEWMKADPADPAVLMAAGVLHELQNNPAAAEQTYAALLARYPTFSPASVRVAYLQAAKAETLPKAFETASKLRQARPEDPDVAALLGVVSYKRADYARAAQLLFESSRQRANDPQVWYYLGLSRQQTKQPAEARQALERFLVLEATGERATEARRVLAQLK